MKVIICGAGQVGWQIARHLSGERNDVTVVDSNADLVRRATDTLDVQGIAGFASYPDVLDRAGRPRCRDDHRRNPFGRGQHGDLSGRAFGLWHQPQDRAPAQPVLSRCDLFRSLPPRSHADRRGDQPRKGSRKRRAAAPFGPGGFRHRGVHGWARRICWASRSMAIARW